MIQILIADDYQLIRDAWTTILNRDKRFRVVEGCSDSVSTVTSCRKLQPDILLLDIYMTPFNGIEAAKRIRRVSPATGIIAVTVSNHTVHAKQMLQVGALGYVTKNSSVEEMQEAILEVSKGHQYICKEMQEQLSDSFESPDADASIQSLTGRELQIIKMIKDGNSSREISTALDISIKTVEVHRYNILKKLHVKNAVALVKFIDENKIRI